MLGYSLEAPHQGASNEYHNICFCGEIRNILTRYPFLSGAKTTILFVLKFYGPVNPMGSCRARSVYLTTRLLGRLSPLSG